MKNTKKIIAMTIAFIMTGVMLAGCGNGVDHKDYMKDSDSVTASVDKDVEKDSDKKSETADKADTDKKDEAQSETDKKADSADKADKDSTAETANQSDNSSSADNSSNTGNSGNAGNSNSGSVNKPNTGSGNNGNHNGGSNNNGNGNNGGGNNKPAPHEHSYQVVSSTNGDCSHAGTVTKKCSCGDTVTENLMETITGKTSTRMFTTMLCTKNSLCMNGLHIINVINVVLSLTTLKIWESIASTATVVTALRKNKYKLVTQMSKYRMLTLNEFRTEKNALSVIHISSYCFVV